MKPKIILWLALILSGNCYAAIVYPKAPDGGRQIVYKNLDPKFLGVSRIEELIVGDPHREYFVGLTNLAFGHLLSAAKFGGWRYLLIHGTNAVGVAELGKTLGFNSIQKSFFPNATQEALRVAEELPQIKKSDYELRYLDIPSVLFVAGWLHGNSDDIIIPLPNTFGRWNAYQPYSESQMIKLLKPEAKKVMEQPKLLR